MNKQIVASDLRAVLRDLKKLEQTPGIDPMVLVLLRTLIRLVDTLRKQIAAI